MLDILIKNGLIVDGTGEAPYKGDIGIKDEKIIEIGKNINKEAITCIDASELVVAPGFIDVHSHNDLVPFMDEKIKNLKLMQGVTTELVGQCGLGVVPCVEGKSDLWKNYVRGVVGDPEMEWNFEGLANYMQQIEGGKLKNNYCTLISHGAVKAWVMDFEKSIPTPKQLDSMCNIVEESMKNGAFGMSIGLQYMPGIYSNRNELSTIFKIIEGYEGIVMVHLRNHDNTIIDALNEIISIAEITRVKLHISHMRSYNSKDLGAGAEELIKIVEAAADGGIRITFDEHLYLSGSTLMTQLLPPWVSGGKANNLTENLKDKDIIIKLKKELEDRSIRYLGWDNYSAVTGWDGILLTSVKRDENMKYIGRTVGEISRELQVHPVDFAARLLIEEEAGVGIVTLNVFSEEDTVELINHPLQMIGSDSIPAGVPHPRLYGNYPLLLGKFVRDKKYISLENAIHKATGLPARTLGIKNIGELSAGKTADITIFDFNNILGYEDYRNPALEPRGIEYVILNGKLAVKNGEVCSGNYGRILRAR